MNGNATEQNRQAAITTLARTFVQEMNAPEDEALAVATRIVDKALAQGPDWPQTPAGG